MGNSSSSSDDDNVHKHATNMEKNRGEEEEAVEPVPELVGLIFSKDFSVDSVFQTLFSSYYSKLKTKIECLETTHNDYDVICKYIQNTHGPTHDFKIKVKNIFNIYRAGEFRNYKPNKIIGNRKLLWHGTKISNYRSILENGLLTEPPSNVSINGKMFGKGVYFADVVTKAAQYCDNVPRKKGILILAEVALGKHYYKTKSEKIERLPAGKNSVKGLGKYKPKKTGTIRNEYGTQIPLGPLEYHNDLTSDLTYSEYIVYDNNQIFMRYLVHFDFID